MPADFGKPWIRSLPWLVWLAVLALGYWAYQLSRLDSRLLLDTDVRAAVLSLGDNLPTATTGRMRIVHFLDPACPCTAFTLNHLNTLQPLFQKLQPEQWLVSPQNDAAADKLAASIGAATLAENLPLNVAPAIAIWSPDGQLAYFGPYSLSMICGQDELLTRILIASAESRWSEEPYPIETGCFCPWSRP
jgi:hypothetical protein